MPGTPQSPLPKVCQGDVRRIQSQPAMVARVGPCGFRQAPRWRGAPVAKQYGRTFEGPRRLFASKSSWSGVAGLWFKRFRQGTWLQAQSWEGPQDTAPVRLRAAPPWRSAMPERTQFPASHQARGASFALRRHGWRLPEGKDIMPNKMLIDASHPEETRVVVVRGNRIEEFDFESQDKKQLKGNIYLARVTRVEPSLQAAFVEYGGNRHGFLAFSEIHPDYYQIPVADRQALLRAEAEERRRRGRGRRGARTQARQSRPARAGAAARAATGGDEPRQARAASRAHPARRRRTRRRRMRTTTPTRPYEDACRTRQSRRAESTSDAPSKSRRRATEPAMTTSREGGPTSIAAEVDVDVDFRDVAEAQRSEGERGGAIEEVHSHHDDDEHEVEIGRRRRRAGGSAQPPQAAAPALQDPGSHQAPPDPAGAGRQGRARQQGRGADHLPVAGRPLFRADAEHGARRRHLAQDHQRAGPQAPEGSRRRISKCRRAWASSCAPPAKAAPRPRSSATTNI